MKPHMENHELSGSVWKLQNIFFGPISKLGGSVNGVYHFTLNKVNSKALEVSLNKILLGRLGGSVG